MADRRKDSRGKVLKVGETQPKENQYCYRYTDRSGKRKAVYDATLEGLRRKEKQIQRDIDDGIDGIKADTVTLNRYFDAFIETKSDLRSTTKQNYIGMWKANVRDSNLGNMKLSSIRQITIQTFYAGLQKRELSKNTIKLIHNLLMQTFQSAVDSDILRKNPVRGAKYSGTVTKKEALTIRQQEILLDFIQRSNVYHVYEPMIVFMIGTALRIGEVTGLTWQDIDLQNSTVSVNHQLRYKNVDGQTQFFITDTKTDAGNRTIRMTSAVKAAVMKQKEIYLSTDRKSAADIDGYTHFIFCNKNGKPFATNAFNFVLDNIVKRYNIEEGILAEEEEREAELLPHISAHILRHTGCTRMAEAGIDPKTLQAIMGHSDIGVTMNVYNHVDQDRIDKEMEKAENIVKFG